MSEKTRGMRWLSMSIGAIGLTAAALFGSAHGAAASTATGASHATAARGYRESDTLLMVGVCGHAPTDTVFTWAKAKKLLHIR